MASQQKMTPEQYARFLVERFANTCRAAAIRIHIEGGGEFLEKAAACDAWLLNGVTTLTADQIGVLLEVLVMPDPNSPIDPLETENDRRNRGGYINALRARLVLERAKR